MKEQEIISSLKNKEENAADLFLTQYRPLMRYIINPFLHNEQDMEECVDDIALKVCDKIDSFDPEKGSFNAWVTAIARNTALNKTRTYKKHDDINVSLDSEDFKEVASSEPDPEEMALKKEKQELLVKAIKKLSGQEQILFYRRYYYQQPILQIASEMGMTERAAEGKLYRIRNKLKSMVGGELL